MRQRIHGRIEGCHVSHYHPDGRLAPAVIDDGGSTPETIDYPA